MGISMLLTAYASVHGNDSHHNSFRVWISKFSGKKQKSDAENKDKDKEFKEAEEGYLAAYDGSNKAVQGDVVMHGDGGVQEGLMRYTDEEEDSDNVTYSEGDYKPWNEIDETHEKF